MNIKRIIHLKLVNMFIIITDKSTFYITTSAKELASQHKINIELL